MASSTGHFPGAPINTDPITTMATSTSQPVTSPSGASFPFLAGFPGLGSPPGASTSNQPAKDLAQPASTSARPGSSAAGAAGVPRAQSSASNKADKEPGKESESGEPATSSDLSSSGDATSTTNTTTTTATTTGTTGTNTTTTTSTTITTTGKISPSRPTQSSFQEAIAKCNNSLGLFLIRKLRAKQDKIADLFLTDNIDNALSIDKIKDYSALLHHSLGLYEPEFSKLDTWAKRLPKVIPPIDNINVMRTLYIQEHTMDHTNINHLVEKMIDAGNWNEGNFQVFLFLSEMLRVPPHHQNNTLSITDDFEKQPLPEIVFGTSQTTAHEAFENAYKQMKKEIMSKSLGIYPRTLQSTRTSLVIEFQFGYGNAKKEVTEHDVLYTIKILVVEKCGTIEFINIMPPTEPWVSRNDYGRIEVNPFALSRFEVYRRLTKTANLNLQHFFGSNNEQVRAPPRWTSNTLLVFVSMFGKIRDIFTARCRICKRHLKNYLPPTAFDLRSPTVCVHESCRTNVHIFKTLPLSF